MTDESGERASPEQIKAAVDSITEVFGPIAIFQRRMEILNKFHAAALAGTFDAEAANQMLLDHEMPEGLRRDTVHAFTLLQNESNAAWQQTPSDIARIFGLDNPNP